MALLTASEVSSAQVATVHEWGTFTCLQNEQGEEIGGINSDDEALPQFVHRLEWAGVDSPSSKSSPRCNPDITMRLETPVTYFHPPLNTTQTLQVNVSATFHGGVLNEYYPYAATEVDSQTTNALPDTFRITKDTVSSIHWNGVRIGDQADPLPTNYPVWLAPRKVGSAATLKLYKPGPPGSKPDDDGTTEGEVFLFYRGVGHLQSPVTVQTSASQITARIRGEAPFHVAAAWLLEVAPVGTLARFTYVGQMDSETTRSLETSLDGLQFTSNAQADLRGQLREALNAEGLMDDEAAAMLETWQHSYFEAPGMRLFYLLPQKWTDTVLPLKIDGPAHVEHRVMMGRIELVTQQQRELLRKIATLPATPQGVQPDPRLDCYNQLGRFANALVLEELKNHPSPGLRSFIQQYNLGSESVFP
jgi:hypothetical protein